MEEKKFEKLIIPEIRNRKQAGLVADATYLDNCHQCVAVTDGGCILVYGNTLYTQEFEEAELDNSKIFTKTIKVSSDPIRCVVSVDG